MSASGNVDHDLTAVRRRGDDERHGCLEVLDAMVILVTSFAPVGMSVAPLNRTLSARSEVTVRSAVSEGWSGLADGVVVAVDRFTDWGELS